MATIALGIGAVAGATALSGGALTALGTVTALSIGAGVGGFIDSAFLYPSIFPPPDIEGPKLNEIPGVSASEGSPINYFAGPHNRVGGTVLYLPKRLIEREEVEEIGKDQEFTTTSYFVNMAVALGRGEIETVSRIWANGKLIYRESNATIEVTSSLLSLEVRQLWAPIGPEYAHVESPAEGPDLTEFVRGTPISMSGWTNSGNNLQIGIPPFIPIVVGVGTTAGGGTWLDIWAAAYSEALVDEAAGAEVTINQTDFLSFRKDKFSAVIVHTGADDQDVDPLLFSWQLLEWLTGSPVPNVAYVGIAFVVIHELALEDFGNRIPQLLFEVRQATFRTVGSVIGDFLEMGGLSPSDYDVSDVQDVEVKGYLIENSTSPLRALRPLMRANNIVVQETSGGVLRFFKRGDERVHVFQEKDLSAHSPGEDPPRKLLINDIASHGLPSEVNVQYYDITNELQRGSQREPRVIADIQTVISLDLPLAMAPGQARAIAARELWTAWINRQTVTLSLPPSYISVREQDILQGTVDGTDYRIIVIKVDRGNNFQLNIEGLIESAESLEFSESPGEDGLPSDDFPEFPTFLIPGIVDTAPFSSGVVGFSGIYVSAAALDPNAPWQGASLFMSSQGDVDENFSLVGSPGSEASMGKATGVLAAGGVGWWDRANSVTVEMFHGSLLSHTADDVIGQGHNIAILGDEVIAFQNAELIAPNTYKLSLLLRGMRNTEAAMATHVVDERFIPISNGNMTALQLDEVLLNLELFFRVLSPGADISDAPSTQLTYQGRWTKPFQVCRGRAKADSVSRAIIIEWERRSMYLHRMFGAAPLPADVNGDRYRLEIFSGIAPFLLLRRVVEFDAEGGATDYKFVYTWIMQGQDGFTGDATVKIYHLAFANPNYGESEPIEFLST